MAQWALVEKANRHALHGLFESKERADSFLKNTVPLYVSWGYYADKALKADDFEVIAR